MPFQLTDVVKNLLILNILMFIGAFTILGDSNLLGQGRNILGLAYFETEFFKPYQLVSHLFMHQDFMHLFFNMLGLVIFGPKLERYLGAKHFLILYFVAALGAVVLHTGVQYIELHHMGNENILRGLSWGASGALYGIIIGYALKFPNDQFMLIIPPMPVKAKYIALFYIGYDLFAGFNNFNTGIAHFAHLGGALFAFLLIKYWDSKARR